VLGLFASDANATAENEAFRTESAVSALTKGTRKSNHPLDVGSLGVCTKFCRKKQEACCSIGTCKAADTPVSIEDSESDGDIRVFSPVAFLSSSGVLENVIWPFRNTVMPVFFPCPTDLRALRSVA